jgi:hypothetical protein
MLPFLQENAKALILALLLKTYNLIGADSFHRKIDGILALLINQLLKQSKQFGLI